MGSNKKDPGYGKAADSVMQGRNLAFGTLQGGKDVVPNNYNFNAGILGGSSSKYDPNTKTVSTSLNSNADLDRALSGSIKGLADFDTNVENEVKQADDAYYKPAQENIKSTLGDLIYGNGGRGVQGNSLFQGIIGGQAANLATNDAQNRLNIRNTVRDSALSRLGQRFQMALQPYTQLLGVGQQTGNYAAGAPQNILDLIKGQAGVLSDAGNQQGNIYTQQANYNAQNQGGFGRFLGNLLSQGVGIAGQAALNKFMPV